MLISLSVDYHAADVATRERFHIPPQRLSRHLLGVVPGVVGGGVVTVRTTVSVLTTVWVFVFPPPQPARSSSATSGTGRRAGRKIGAG